MRLYALITVIFLNGCCPLNYPDCGCIPPDPELDEETLKWIKPYNNDDFFVFEDSIGNIDSLLVNRKSETEFYGGDECGCDCQVEIGVLKSTNNSNLTFTITATEIQVLKINNQEEMENQIFVAADIGTNKVMRNNENATATLVDDYEWNNKKLKVFEIKCETGSNCFDYEMNEMIVSRDFGLIEYRTKDGMTWKKIN